MQRDRVVRVAELFVALVPFAIALGIAYGRTKEIPAIKLEVSELQVKQAKTETAQEDLKEMVIDIRHDVKTLIRRRP